MQSPSKVSLIFLTLMYTYKSVLSTNSENKTEGLRLPRNLRPRLYKLEVKPYLDSEHNFTFEGRVTISFDCVEDTNSVVLHSKDLIINEDTVRVWHGKDKLELPVKKQEYDLKKDFYVVHPGRFLKARESYEIQIDFKGDLGNKLIGFYRGSYNDTASGEQRWFATTQFEPIYCRRAFPSFDEPDFKAEFEVSVTRLKNMTSVSNMPLKATTDASHPDWVTDHFEKTVPMSTYLVAYIIFDFGHLESPDGKFRVWARKEALEHTRYALSIGPPIQKYFEEYFGIPFPLPKQDLVAIPDFYHGAMENFGLITFRETGMLYDPNKTSDAGQYSLTHVISHELSHQWFGNLVTMKWFDGLWLNEGFAAYVEYIGVDKVQPTWHTMDNFVTYNIYPVLDFDAWNYTHPIWANVENPDDIDELFDFISYKKGASIIRMMANFLSEKTMRAGLSNYLKKWKYNNTIQEDLWDSLTEQAYTDKTLATRVTVKDIMDTWTMQKGFPIVNVQRSYNGSNKIILTQEKFTFSNVKNLDDNSSWWIPISYATPQKNSDFQQTEAQVWLTNKDKLLEIEIDVPDGQWLILNIQQTGFFRVNYDAENWRLIKSQLDNNLTAIHLINRAQIINDLFSLARVSSLTYEHAFDVTNFIRNDDEYVPWQSYFGSTNYVDDILETTPIYGKFKEYMRKQLDSQYTILGFEGKEGTTRPQKLHRSSVIAHSCYYGLEKCIGFAKNKFLLWMNSTNPDSENTIRKNFRNTVYCVSIRNGGEKEWDFLWKRYLNSTVDAARVTILTSLSCTREPWMLNRFMKWAISPVTEGNIAQQHVTAVLGSVARTVIGSKLLIRFLDDNWDGVFKRLGKSGLQQLDSVIKSITSRLNTPSDLKQFVSLKGKKDFGPATLSVNQGLERIQTNIQWMDKHYRSVSKWLSQKTNT